jgi:acetylornithine deacetylase/succinyl-diaminopimelate desuccinylase-like protein
MTPLLLAALLAAAPAEVSDVPSAADRALAREVFEQLVGLDTSQGTGETTRAAQAVAARLRAAGVPAADVRVVGPSKRKMNLVARLRAPGNQAKQTAKRPPLLLLAHLDVVDARRADWTMEPFKLVEKDGYYYGRGTQDDKGLASLWVAIVVRLHRDRAAHPLDRDVILALTADEENGPENGIQWLLKHERPLIEAELALTEGAGGELKGGRRLSVDVQPAEKSYLSFTIEATNKGGHSSLPEGDNAIVRVARAATRVHDHAFPVELTPLTRGWFQHMATLETGVVAADLRAVSSEATGTAARVPEAAARLAKLPAFNARMRTTCVPTMIEGGHAENALPQRARVTINCRVLPGHGADEVAHALREAIADPGVTLTQLHEWDASPASPLPPALVTVIQRAAAAVWPGVPVVPVMMTGASDGRFLRAAGIPTYGLTGLFVDIDDIRAHGRDERLLVRSFTEAHDFLLLVVRALVSP